MPLPSDTEPYNSRLFVSAAASGYCARMKVGLSSSRPTVTHASFRVKSLRRRDRTARSLRVVHYSSAVNIRDRLAGEAGPAMVSLGLARQGGGISGLGWHFVGPTDLPRQPQEAPVEPYLREALIRLNPDIAANPSRVGKRRVRRLGARRALDALRSERRARDHPPYRLRRHRAE